MMVCATEKGPTHPQRPPRTAVKGKAQLCEPRWHWFMFTPGLARAPRLALARALPVFCMGPGGSMHLFAVFSA